MASLIKEMRRLGYVVHFAGVRLPAMEKATTLPLVDEWVADFEPLQRPWGWARIWASLAYRNRRWLLHFRWAKDHVDEHFYDEWLSQARDLQHRHRYTRVLVPYVYHSKFLLAFPDPCLRIIDAHDAFSRPRRRVPGVKTPDYMRFFSPEDEKRGLARAQRIIAIQQKEAHYLKQLLGSKPEVQVVGHLADPLEQYLPPPHLLRMGYMGSRKNSLGNVDACQWFLREVWPKIRKHLPTAEIWLGGEISDQNESGPGVRILGPVPSLADFYRDCPVIINPALTGSGISIKVIEAALHGRPVVTTRVGVEGLESFLGHGLFVCDSAREFANAAIILLSDLLKARQLGEEAFLHARNYFAENRRALAAVLSNDPP